MPAATKKKLPDSNDSTRKPPIRWSRFLLTAAILYGVWIVLSGRFYAQYLVIGALGTLAITAGIFPWRSSRPFPLWRFLTFIPWLLGQIIVSNLRVARTALAPLSAIQPQFVKVQPGMGDANEDERALTVLGCAITLTPGTLTVEATPEILYVHALDADSARDIRAGTMSRRVARMFAA